MLENKQFLTVDRFQLSPETQPQTLTPSSMMPTVVGKAAERKVSPAAAATVKVSRTYRSTSTTRRRCALLSELVVTCALHIVLLSSSFRNAPVNAPRMYFSRCDARTTEGQRFLRRVPHIIVYLCRQAENHEPFSTCVSCLPLLTSTAVQSPFFSGSDVPY